MSEGSYRLTSDGDFVVENYNHAKPFASFLPGVAGLTGRPLWAFYCNRAQGIASFGIGDKNGSMLEFQPAVKAYVLAATHGFRTFLTVNGKPFEPFVERDADASARQVMTVRAHELELEEHDPEAGLRTGVVYYTVPEDEFAAFVRSVEITNESDAAVDLDLLDGLPYVVPAFIKNGSIKDVANTKCGTVEVLGFDDDVVYTRSTVKSSDAVKVELVEDGNFCFGLVTADDASRRMRVVADPALVFGDGNSFTRPRVFEAAGGGFEPAAPRGENYLPCAFVHTRARVEPGAKLAYASVWGQAPRMRDVVAFRERVSAPGFLSRKRARNREIVDGIQDRLLTVSADPTFDAYGRYTFLDNALRGGVPVTVGDKAVHVYFRKHGDMERDYNDYALAPEPYSQGNGAFRDVSQNRRLDPLFNADVGADNIRTFFDAVQLDGNNPLLYEGTAFELCPDASDVRALVGDGLAAVFTAGDAYRWACGHAAASDETADELMRRVIAAARKVERWRSGLGYWVDHWTYSLDHLESYAALYPERVSDLVFESRDFTYFDNPESVLPRAKRYSLDPATGEVRQLNSLEVLEEKKALIASRGRDAQLVRGDSGRGEVYYTSLAEKLLCLIATRFASLDPEMRGVEMLGNRPGWNDAMNGLPGMLGSSAGEAAELVRYIRWMRRAIEQRERAEPVGPIRMSLELAKLISSLNEALEECGDDSHALWDHRHAAYERHIAATRVGVLGQSVTMVAAELGGYLQRMQRVVERAIGSSRDEATGLYPTFHYYRVTEHQTLDVDGADAIAPKRFQRRDLPAFLEGQVRVMKILRTDEQRRALYEAVRRSPLYDEKLGMYRLNESLSTAPPTIGRAGLFPPGWLENESIWMHMEYKYLLEVLRAGLCDEFFADAKACLPPFLDPAVYGRSPLEHSSFICSSAHPDPARHGAGYYARLSGATVEFLSMHAHMTGLDRALRLDGEGALEFRLEPRLPAWLFTKEGRDVSYRVGDDVREAAIPVSSFATVFLGATLVVVRNDAGGNTWGPDAPTVSAYELTGTDGVTKRVEAPALGAEDARRVRAGDIRRIDVILSRA